MHPFKIPDKEAIIRIEPGFMCSIIQDVCFRVALILWVRTYGHLLKVFLMSLWIAITFPPSHWEPSYNIFQAIQISEQNFFFFFSLTAHPSLLFPISSCRNCLWREHMSESLWFSWTPNKAISEASRGGCKKFTKGKGYACSLRQVDMR